ncbi:unnamed protein product [marine sediment metagenome]|uniref:Uncharacterized protein n=1 Tax=marine sediment metagenome TaxID=412755 RepID=X1SZQ0_9ZZZZ
MPDLKEVPTEERRVNDIKADILDTIIQRDQMQQQIQQRQRVN